MAQGAENALPDYTAADEDLINAWTLREDGLDARVEHEVESRLAISNGFIGVRGSLVFPARFSNPRSYVAGLYDRKSGPQRLSALVPAPAAFPLRLFIDGDELAVDSGHLLSLTRLLDYRRGIRHDAWQHELPSGRRVNLDALRFTSRVRPGLAVQLLRIRCDGPTAMAITTPDSGMALTPAGLPSAWKTADGTWVVSRLLDMQVETDGRVSVPWSSTLQTTTKFQTSASVSLVASYALHSELTQASAQSKDGMRRARRNGMRRIYASHAGRWRERWQASDVMVEGDIEAQKALRFAIYHLNSAADPSSANVSIGARGLTGDSYMGHVFWDTEIFMLPFYTLTWPEAARSLLEYRHRTLPAARRKAQELGYQGALYAWESTDTGDEATPPYAIGPQGQVIQIRNGTEEQHVNAAVAYAVWQYWLATLDVEFMLSFGAEILLETARFWASRLRLEADGKYHIRHVIGPDEYHEDVDDNAYTNYMASWNIARALEIADLLSSWNSQGRPADTYLKVDSKELASWSSLVGRVFMPLESESGVIEQFDGYFGLEHIDLAAIASRTAPIDALLGTERTRHSQVIKQADVLMLMALLPRDFPLEKQRRNFEFYEPRCGHGSSLSPSVHSLVAARAGLGETAHTYFQQTAAIDLEDSMGNSSAGLHMAALGGLWQAAVFGFGGLRLEEDRLSLDPRLPSGWQGLRFPIHWRGRRLTVDISRERQQMDIVLAQGRPMQLNAGGRNFRLERGKPLILPYRDQAQL